MDNFLNDYLKSKISDYYLYRQLDDTDIQDPDYCSANTFACNEVGDITQKKKHEKNRGNLLSVLKHLSVKTRII